MDHELEVLAAVDAFDDALEARDVDAVRSLWVDDDDLTFWGSGAPEVAVGRPSLDQLLALLCDAPGTFTVDWHERRVHVEGDVAWVNAEGRATWEREPGEVLELPYRQTAVLVRRADRWLWHTHHGSEPTPFELPTSTHAPSDGARATPSPAGDPGASATQGAGRVEG